MTNENVEELYGKFSKDVAKKDLNGLKRALAACDNSKYAMLKNLALKKKNPLKSFNGLCVFIAMGLGGAFFVWNAVLLGLLLPVRELTGYDVFIMLTLVFDCILAAVLLCYYAVYIPVRYVDTGKTNLLAINNIINN